jgi:hypothetical protein
MTTAFPLAWPDGWPRTPDYKRLNDRVFASKIYGGVTMARAGRQLRDELLRLNARGIVISTNVALRQDGLPYSDQRKLTDPGVAVYFQLKGKAMVMATDRYKTVGGNMRSLALAIEAMRQLERHGGGTMMERAFTGFTAIAPPGAKRPWREVFGLKPGHRFYPSDISALYRTLAKDLHPDVGGSEEQMRDLNAAYAEARKELGL